MKAMKRILGQDPVGGFITESSAVHFIVIQSVAIRVSLLLIFAVCLSSSAALPQFGHPEPKGPPLIEPASRDTFRVEIPDPDTWPIAEERKSVPETRPAEAPTRPRAPVPSPNETPTEAEVSATDAEVPKQTPPAITVSPPKVELEQLETDVLADIAEATRLVQGLKSGDLPDGGQDDLATIHSMILQAREALSKQDVQAAAGLARKARLLAVELTSS